MDLGMDSEQKLAEMVAAGKAKESHKPMHHYNQQAMARAPHLVGADVMAYRDHVQASGPFIDVQDLPKCDRRAAELRQTGNRLYLGKNYPQALGKYNESLCWAETGSEHLSMGYANRSAVYYEQEEYQIALANIALAKAHKYPQKLMPKLLAREQNCHEKIRSGQAKCTHAHTNRLLDLKLETNPRIPFLAAGIRMDQLPGWGRSMIAERPFKVGDVILFETPMVACVNAELKYLNCDNCSIENFHSLIPCPKCVSVMYCGQRCLEKGWQSSHRFECGISEKLQHIKTGATYMSSRMLFYGLTMFDDDLDKMMEYCDANKETGGNPFNLDYRQYDPLEEFRLFNNLKLNPTMSLSEDLWRYCAAVYSSVYLQHPLVKSIFNTGPKRDFMLQNFVHYMRLIILLLVGASESHNHQIYTVGSVFNHSCDPNTIQIYRSGRFKLIVTHPIAAGDQICFSYGPLYSMNPDYERRGWLAAAAIKCCMCVVCRSPRLRLLWLAKGLMAPPTCFRKHIAIVERMLADKNADYMPKMKALEQFVVRYANLHPQKDYDDIVQLYRLALIEVFDVEAETAVRAKFTF